MNHDYDDELERGAERRSRRNPRQREIQDGGQQPQSGASARSERERWENRRRQSSEDIDHELDILGDPSVYPVKPQGEMRQTADRRDAAGQAGNRQRTAGQTGKRPSDDRRNAGRQTAAAGGGFSPRMEAQLDVSCRVVKETPCNFILFHYLGRPPRNS